MILSKKEELKIIKLAEEERRKLDLGMGSIGSEIETVLGERDIKILYFASDFCGEKGIDGLYLKRRNSVLDRDSHYIALNTTRPFDLQLFNLCHEYYHHICGCDHDVHVYRFGDADDEITDKKANRFAAEFLLPTKSLNDYMLRIKGDLGKLEFHIVLRVIANLHIHYKLPYRSIVKRIHEAEYINDDLRENLLNVEERDHNSIYYRICRNINERVIDNLNSPRNYEGVDPVSLDLIAKNYDDNNVSVDTAINDLKLFGKTLEDFGYSVGVSDDTIKELDDLFSEDD